MAILPTTKLESLPSDLFSKIAEFSGKAPDSLACISKNVQQSMQQYNEFYKNRLQTLSRLEGYKIDVASGFYPVEPLLKQHRIDKNLSLALQVKALYECYRKRISEIDPRNQYHLSLDDLPKLFAYDKAFNKIQLWKKLPGGTAYLSSPSMSNKSLPDQASQLRTWLESNPAVVNDVHSLDLANLKLTSIPEEIGLLTNLTSLDLSSNQISKIENLSTLTQLTRLSLSDNQIRKIENLDALTQLKWLFLDNNQISKIENPGALAQLKWLIISNNQISKIENLDTLTQLGYLTLLNNQISKIENLGALAQLRWLSLGNNQISKIENLDTLTNLTSLNLLNNQISKIENLGALANLRKLHLNNNPIRFSCDLLRYARQIKPFSIILKTPYQSVVKKIEDSVVGKPDSYLFGLD